MPLIAVVLALLLGGVMIALMDADPITAYRALWEGAFGSKNTVADTLVKATPLLLVGIGICISFRGGVVNIGGEGQMIAGGLVAVAIGLKYKEADPTTVIITCLVASFAAGAIWGGIAGVLKAYFNVNEILSTIMLNQVAVQMMNYLLNGPLLDPAEVGTNHIPKTARILAELQLPRLTIGLFDGAEIFARTRLHSGLILAIALAAVIYLLLWRTPLGYRIRAVGFNERAARYAGINVRRQVVLAMFLAGGCAGLAGVVQVLGLQYRLQTDGSPAGFTANAGFNGIVAALFGGLNPFGAIPASIFFGGLLVGAQNMQRTVGVPAALITAVNGIIVIFAVSSQLFVQRRRQRRLQMEAPASAAPAAVDPIPRRAES
jgi:simple sugar transport system permease protein